MWLPSFRTAFGLCLFAVLAACTITPVHDRQGAAGPQIALRYAEPATRLEQVFYQELSLHLPESRDTLAPLLTVSLSTANQRIGESRVASPVVERQVIVQAHYRLERDGELIASGTRSATAGFQAVGQVIADDEALANAQERAVRAAAQTVRQALYALP